MDVFEADELPQNPILLALMKSEKKRPESQILVKVCVAEKKRWPWGA